MAADLRAPAGNIAPDGQKLSFEYEGTLPTRTTWTGEVNGSVGREYDIFFVLEADVVPAFGTEFAVGLVYDSDDPQASGIFENYSVAAGGNLGIADGFGYCKRELEGWGYGVDFNIPPFMSGQLLFDEQGLNGFGVTVGQGEGASISTGETSTFSFRTLGTYIDGLNQAIERELQRFGR